MGIAVALKEQYANAIKKLFPQGEYWAAQFADPNSDISLFTQAKADELLRFRSRMSKLYSESHIDAAEEMIADWERVLLDKKNFGQPLAQRRELLQLNNVAYCNRAVLQKIAGLYGFKIIDIEIYGPAFFGFSCFGIDRIANPAAWHVINIFVDTCGNGDQIPQFESFLQSILLANHIPQFFYDGGNS